MKKLISLLLCIVVLSCLVGCNKDEQKVKVNHSAEKKFFFEYKNNIAFKHIYQGSCYIYDVTVKPTENNTVCIEVDVNVDVEKYESSNKWGISIDLQLLDQNNNIVDTQYAYVPHDQCDRLGRYRAKVYFFNIPDEDATYTAVLITV